MILPERMEDGRLPAFAFPGGYPLYYLTADDGILCPDCANGDNGSEAQNPECQDDRQWRIVCADIHYEGEPITCDHCSAQIESAYRETEPNID
jgi:DNA-directed RNA polymerase subunit RPC12/RpoP